MRLLQSRVEGFMMAKKSSGGNSMGESKQRARQGLLARMGRGRRGHGDKERYPAKRERFYLDNCYGSNKRILD